MGISLPDWARQLNVSEADLAAEWEDVRSRLFAVRTQRVYPLKDDKVLTDWNGLMIAALSTAARILNQPAYTEAAARAASFVLTHLRDTDGRLFHRYRDGQAGITGYADDYAWMIFGLQSLYRADGNSRWLTEAIHFQEILDADYRDRDAGGYFMNRDPNELPARPKELYDGAMPSANSVSLVNLISLCDLTGDETWRERAVHLARSFFGTVSTQPSAHTFFLLGLAAHKSW